MLTNRAPPASRLGGEFNVTESVRRTADDDGDDGDGDSDDDDDDDDDDDHDDDDDDYDDDGDMRGERWSEQEE